MLSFCLYFFYGCLSFPSGEQYAYAQSCSIMTCSFSSTSLPYRVTEGQRVALSRKQVGERFNNLHPHKVVLVATGTSRILSTLRDKVGLVCST